MKIFQYLDAIDDWFDDYVDAFLKWTCRKSDMAHLAVFSAVTMLSIVSAIHLFAPSSGWVHAISLLFVVVFISILMVLSAVLMRLYGAIGVCLICFILVTTLFFN